MTGSSGGVGKELAQILYAAEAKVCVAARSKPTAEKVIEEIKAAFPSSKGQFDYLYLDLSDLTTIKPAAQEFLSKESRLDVLWNNAAVMNTPPGSVTKQGYELQLGTNNVAPFLFMMLLTPLLVQTAQSAPKGSVRVVWVSSSAAEMISPVGGVDVRNLDYKKEEMSGWMKYGVSKAGNILHSNEYAKRYGGEGVVSVVCGPVLSWRSRWMKHTKLRSSKLKADADRTRSLVSQSRESQDELESPYGWISEGDIELLFVYPPIFGAYTELFGGLSPEVMNADWVRYPMRRLHFQR